MFFPVRCFSGGSGNGLLIACRPSGATEHKVPSFHEPIEELLHRSTGHSRQCHQIPSGHSIVLTQPACKYTAARRIGEASNLICHLYCSGLVLWASWLDIRTTTASCFFLEIKELKLSQIPEPALRRILQN